MITPKVMITSDASCTMPPEYTTNLSIPSISCTVRTESGEFLENAEISTENILSYMQGSKKVPELIAPTAEDYRRFFTKQQELSPVICHFNVSSKISVAHSNAVKAAASMKNVYVFDTLQLGAGMIFHVMQGARLAAEGFGAEFIMKSGAELASKIINTSVGENADFLRIYTGGKSALCSAMDLFCCSPVISLKNGEAKCGVVHCGIEDDFRELFIKKELADRKNLNTEMIFLAFANPYEADKEKYVREVRKYADFGNVIITGMSPRLAMYTGCGGFGMSFLLK